MVNVDHCTIVKQMKPSRDDDDDDGRALINGMWGDRYWHLDKTGKFG